MKSTIAAAAVLMGTLAVGAVGCAGLEPKVCASPSPGPGGLVAAQCATGERFTLGGADAVASDLGTITVDNTGAVEVTLSLTEDSSRRISAQLHIADPDMDYREVFVTEPKTGADCLGNVGTCELSWDFSDSGYAVDFVLGLPPQTWIQLSDGTDDIVIWVVQVTDGP